MGIENENLSCIVDRYLLKSIESSLLCCEAGWNVCLQIEGRKSTNGKVDLYV